MEKICVHAYVTGRVQGVFFRRETCEEARRLGLGGWVKNLPDGRVEVMICGERAAVETLSDWLWIGPEAAKVSLVEFEEKTCENMKDFKVI